MSHRWLVKTPIVTFFSAAIGRRSLPSRGKASDWTVSHKRLRFFRALRRFLKGTAAEQLSRVESTYQRRDKGWWIAAVFFFGAKQKFKTPLASSQCHYLSHYIDIAFSGKHLTLIVLVAKPSAKSSSWLEHIPLSSHSMDLIQWHQRRSGHCTLPRHKEMAREQLKKHDRELIVWPD